MNANVAFYLLHVFNISQQFTIANKLLLKFSSTNIYENIPDSFEVLAGFLPLFINICDIFLNRT